MSRQDVGLMQQAPRILRAMQGIALLEVLIAVLILGIGLLGLAALQVTSARMVGDAQNRTQALMLAEDLFEKIRSNAPQAANYSVVVGVGDCEANLVPVGDVTNRDLTEWSNAVRCLLPEGEATVRVAPGAGAPGTVTINVQWRDRLGDSENSLLFSGSFL